MFQHSNLLLDRIQFERETGALFAMTIFDCFSCRIVFMNLAGEQALCLQAIMNLVQKCSGLRT